MGSSGSLLGDILLKEVRLRAPGEGKIITRMNPRIIPWLVAVVPVPRFAHGECHISKGFISS